MRIDMRASNGRSERQLSRFKRWRAVQKTAMPIFDN
jgi:hypothetical protein